jgi:hypothetical protein
MRRADSGVSGAGQDAEIYLRLLVAVWLLRAMHPPPVPLLPPLPPWASQDPADVLSSAFDRLAILRRSVANQAKPPECCYSNLGLPPRALIKAGQVGQQCLLACLTACLCGKRNQRRPSARLREAKMPASFYRGSQAAPALGCARGHFRPSGLAAPWSRASQMTSRRPPALVLGRN